MKTKINKMKKKSIQYEICKISIWASNLIMNTNHQKLHSQMYESKDVTTFLKTINLTEETLYIHL